MTERVTIRPSKLSDLKAIEELTTRFDCVLWGRLPAPTAKLLSDRWQQPQVPPAFIRVAETTHGLYGYSDVYKTSPTLGRFEGIASNLDVARSLIHWTCDEATSNGIVLQTSLGTSDTGRKPLNDFADHPLYSLLEKTGFKSFSTTRMMRLKTKNAPELSGLPESYRLVDFNESLLPALMSTYYAAWPKDYYENEDLGVIENTFRETTANNLHLVVSNNGNVVGYVLLSRTADEGVIDEVAVHPDHRSKGVGEALIRFAIKSLGDRTITLVVMNENPARYLYERLGFVVVEEHLDLARSLPQSETDVLK